MARAKPSREEQKAKTRQALLVAAADVIAKHGIEAASLDRIAEHAGLTKGAVYSNFASKEDLIFALSDTLNTTIDVRDVLGGEDPFDEQLAELGRVVARTAPTISRTEWRLQLELLQYGLRNERVRERLVGEAATMLATEGRWLEEAAHTQGWTLPVTGAELLTLLRALSVGLALQQALNPSEVPEELFGRGFALLAGNNPASAAAPVSVQQVPTS